MRNHPSSKDSANVVLLKNELEKGARASNPGDSPTWTQR